MKSNIIKSIISLALISPIIAHAENYAFNFKANPGADGGGPLFSSNDIEFNFFIDTALIPSISISSLNRSEYWTNGGFVLLMSHDGKTVRLNDAIDTSSTYLRPTGGGFIEIYSDINEFFDVDFHPGNSFVDRNALSYDAFVYGQIDVYNGQKQFQDLFSIVTAGNTALLKDYVSPVPEPATLGMWLLGAMAICHRRKRRDA